MIYTSYFARIPKLEKNGIIPIAICGGIPDGYSGLWYKKVAPSWSIFSEYKFHGNNTILYTTRFINEILNKRDPQQVYLDLYNLAGERNDFAMICYEKPGEFCHRHIVARWLTQHSIPCQEWFDPLEF